jgi:hypothetical protein
LAWGPSSSIASSPAPRSRAAPSTTMRWVARGSIAFACSS